MTNHLLYLDLLPYHKRPALQQPLGDVEFPGC